MSENTTKTLVFPEIRKMNVLVVFSDTPVIAAGRRSNALAAIAAASAASILKLSGSIEDGSTRSHSFQLVFGAQLDLHTGGQDLALLPPPVGGLIHPGWKYKLFMCYLHGAGAEDLQKHCILAF